ncbi:hypothetical protein F4808DRAFT_432462 [Astrocystis sublimbata]|nr:hypothetical protein F4808DRAFT_432462 [Astrocystis sublimbata]
MRRQTGGQIVDLRSEPSSRALNGRYRRNGKLQSCEPCRKSKLRCDHVVPICSRCVKRRCEDKCLYHPNPLTRKRETTQEFPPTPATTSNEATSPTVLPTVETPEPGSPRSPRYLQVGPSQSWGATPQTPPKLNRAASAPPLHTREPGRLNPGFFGATNPMCIFSENLSKLGVVSAELEGPELPRLMISNNQVVRGGQILSFMEDMTMVNAFLNRFFDLGDGINHIVIEPIMKQWLLKLGAHHGETLKKQNPERLRRLSELLWQNTMSSIFVKEDMDYKAWAMQATGMHIRWEVIGIIAALIGMCATTLNSSDLLLTQHNVSKNILIRKMSDIASTCLNFCRDCEALDDLFVWLLIENSNLTAALKGDGSFAVYRETGEFVNAVVAMGLHIDVRQGKPRLPFFLEQLRVRVAVGAYTSEISTSSYLGRPPRLSYRYCNLTAPLDIPDVQLVASEGEIARILASLDDNGYNTSGRLSHGTWAKTWLEFAPKREEVLDLALGQYSREEILSRAKNIQHESDINWARLPSFITNTADELNSNFNISSKNKRPLESFLRIALRQGFRANELLLQRVLIRKTGASWDKLVEVASAIFQDILHISKRHDLASIMQSSIAALLAIQGLRSASVIAVELLKQEQLPNYPKNPLLPRSRTIQDLSVFASRLGDVDPSDGSFVTCDQGRKVITRILDKILSPSNASERPLSSHVQHEQQHHQALGNVSNMEMSAFQSETMPHHEWNMPPDPLEFQLGETNWGIEVPFLGHDSDFMQWLESADWERPI